jgi:hypothetical protein
MLWIKQSCHSDKNVVHYGQRCSVNCMKFYDISKFASSDAFTVVQLRILVFWDMTQHCSVIPNVP